MVAWQPPAPQGRAVFVVCVADTHVRILRDSVAALRGWGFDVHHLVVRMDNRWQWAVHAVEAAGDPVTILPGVGELARVGTAGDLVVLFMAGKDTGRGYLGRLLARGLGVAQIVEGAHFALMGHYDPRVPLLAWGPSATAMALPDIRVVGSPVIEAALAAPRRQPGRAALINLKFGGLSAEAGTAWYGRVRRACRRAGLPTIVSAHPRSLPPDLQIAVTAAPIADLLSRAKLLISRPSTVVYEALAMGVPTLVVPARRDRLVEFAGPMGAFVVARRRAEIARGLRQLSEPGATPDPTAFLAAHVDVQAGRPAALRMAQALVDLLPPPRPGLIRSGRRRPSNP